MGVTTQFGTYVVDRVELYLQMLKQRQNIIELTCITLFIVQSVSLLVLVFSSFYIIDNEYWYFSETRYLLILTENYAALSILPQLLEMRDAITIFGSSFPKDQEYTQVNC